MTNRKVWNCQWQALAVTSPLIRGQLHFCVILLGRKLLYDLKTVGAQTRKYLNYMRPPSKATGYYCRAFRFGGQRSHFRNPLAMKGVPRLQYWPSAEICSH